MQRSRYRILFHRYLSIRYRKIFRNKRYKYENGKNVMQITQEQ